MMAPKAKSKLKSLRYLGIAAVCTALGAAWLAGMRAGVWPDIDAFAKVWAVDRQFTPRMDAEHPDTRYARWGRAVNAVLAV